MDRYFVKVLKTEMLTHNVKRFVLEKPAGYTFIPGQATDVAINQPGLENDLRPFTFTSRTNDNHLEFIIKMYTGHDGMTEKLADVKEGDELIIHEVFGSITYQGPGVFIAGGAGITPFIAILRQLKSADKLAGHTLLFANRTDNDIILKDELSTLLGKGYVDILEKPSNPSIPARYIDRQLLETCINPDIHYYICGPDIFTQKMVDYLTDLGVSSQQIVIEQ